jgi:hypothetical protein
MNTFDRDRSNDGACESCGAREHVHQGFCRKCRRRLMGDSEPLIPERDTLRPHQATPEPLHNPPWLRRGA